MKLEQSFDVAAPIDRVWSTLIDIERVAPCLPGAAVTGRNDDGSYNGTFKVKIGPTSATYSGKLEMNDLQQHAHTATMHAAGTDKRGQGGAKATITSKLTALGDATTRVEVDTDYHITGRLARFGRGGMIEDISERLLSDFAKCLQTSMAAAPELSAMAAGSSGALAAGGPGPGAGGVASGRSGGVAPSEAGADDGVASAAGAAEAGVASVDAGAVEAGVASVDAGAVEAGAAIAQGPGPGVAGPPAQSTEPLDGLPLVRSVLWDRAKGNAMPIAFVLGLFVALLAFRRASRSG